MPTRRRVLVWVCAGLVAVVAATVVAVGSRGDDTPAPTQTAAAPLGLVPLPASLHVDGGTFRLDEDTTVVTTLDADADAAARAAAEGVGTYAAQVLRAPTGLPLQAGTAPPPPDSTPTTSTPTVAADRIDLRFTGAAASTWQPDALLDDPAAERYTLVADSHGVTIESATPQGLFRGVQTLRQLLPPGAAAVTRQPEPAGGWTVPGVHITDQPRYAYRGAMLDVARRFYPVADVERYIDDLAEYKLDVLHLHLSDDQGWRIAIPSMPALAQVGGATQSGWAPGTGGPWYYTQAQYRQIVAYAAKRFVTVVPEIDGPGHSLAAQAADGRLRCDGKPGRPYTGFDVNNPMICASDANMPNVEAYLTAVVDALAAMTPGPYLHVGGDEVPDPPAGWYENYTAAANEAVTSAGKTVVGWHQWAQGSTLPAGSLIQYWGVGSTDRPQIGTDDEGADITDVRQALDAGANLVLSPADRTYLDMKYDASESSGLVWAGTIDLEEAYGWDPATELTSTSDPGKALPTDGRIAGIEAPLWSDRTYPGSLDALPTSTDQFMPVAQYLDHQAFPRLPALAEVAWTPQADRSYATFLPRLEAQAARWDAQGIGWDKVSDVDWP